MDRDISRKTLEIMARANWYNGWLFSFIKPHLGEKVLEVGCGIGSFTPGLLGVSREVVVMDVEQEYLDKVHSQIKSDKLQVIWGDIETGEFTSDPGLFDTIVCVNVLEHIKNDKRAVENMFNRLNISGKLILLVPAHNFLYGSLDENLEHERRYEKVGIRELLANVGFNIEEVRYLNLLGAIGWFVNSKILRRKILPSNQLLLFDKLARPLLLLEKYFEPPFGLSIFTIAKK